MLYKSIGQYMFKEVAKLSSDMNRREQGANAQRRWLEARETLEECWHRKQKADRAFASALEHEQQCSEELTP